jgi:hypothetical protein
MIRDWGTEVHVPVPLLSRPRAAWGVPFEFSASPAPSPTFLGKFLIPLDLGLSITYGNPLEVNGLWLKFSTGSS